MMSFFPSQKKGVSFTPRKINMEPENATLEKENHPPIDHVQVLS